MKNIFIICFFCTACRAQPGGIIINPNGPPLYANNAGTGITIKLPPVVIDTSGFYVLNLIPDFERRTASVTDGKILMFGRTAVSSDVGKIIAIKKARKYTAFRDSAIAWNGKVTGIDAGRLVVSNVTNGDDIEQLQNTASTEIELSSNRWDTLASAIAAAPVIPMNGITTKKIYLNYIGTIAVNPILANGSRGGLVAAGCDSIIIRGIDSAKTRIKFMCEDRAIVNGNLEELNMFLVSTSLAVEHLTIESPDRTSTINATNLSYMKGVNGARSYYNRSMQLLSKDIHTGWENGIDERNGSGADGIGINGHKLYVTIENSKLQAATTITSFSQNGPVKGVKLRNVRITGGGRRKWFPPYIQSISIDTSGAVPLITINNPEASFFQSRSYLAEYDGKPYLQLYPKAEDTITLSFAPPGSTRSPDSYANGNIIFDDNKIAVGDGQEHWVLLRWPNSIDPVAAYITAGIFPQPGSNNPAVTRMLHNGNVTDDENGNGGRYGEIVRSIRTGLPIRMKKIGNVLTILDPIGAHTLPVTTNTAALYTDKLETVPYSTIPVSRSFAARLAGGTALMKGRANTSGEGHVMYIHPNNELDMDSVFVNMDGQDGQANAYAVHYYTSSGVTGTHNVLKVTNWYGTPSYVPYFRFSYPLPPVVELNAGNFTGTATIGQSVINAGALIGVPYTLVPLK